METTQQEDRNAQIAQILYIYNAFRLQKGVKSQKVFADILGINPNTLSGAIKNRPEVSTAKVLKRAEEAAQEHGVVINASDQAQVVNTGDNHGEQKFFNSDSALLIAEMAEQRKMYAAHIDRLLGIIENMQK